MTVKVTLEYKGRILIRVLEHPTISAIKEAVAHAEENIPVKELPENMEWWHIVAIQEVPWPPPGAEKYEPERRGLEKALNALAALDLPLDALKALRTSLEYKRGPHIVNLREAVRVAIDAAETA